MAEQTSNMAEAQTTVQCMMCKKELPCYDEPHSMYFGCPACNTYFKKEQGKQPEFVQKLYTTPVYDFTLPLGARGVINNKTFTVVGQLQKQDMEDDEMVWNEYLLHCPEVDNYFTLAEANGSWTMVWAGKLTDHDMVNVGTTFMPRYEIRQKDTYRRFVLHASYIYNTLSAKGEFDWDVMNESGKNRVSEYADPPDVIVGERMDEEIKWYFGASVDKNEIARVFRINITELLALKKYPDDEDGDEPGYVKKWPVMKRFTGWALLAVLAIWAITWMVKPSHVVYKAGYYTNRDTGAGSLNSFATITTDPFTITASGAVDVDFTASINNEWIELAVEMVNEKTGQTYEFTKELSYYHGVDDGESWSEGDNTDDAVLSRVPPGTYRLNITPYSEIDKTFDITVSVEQNTGITSNIMLLLMVLLAWPFIQYCAVYSYHENN